MSKRQRFSRREKTRILWDCAFIAPQLVLYLGLTIVPFFVALPLLFTDKINFSDIHVNYIGLENFVRVFVDPFVTKDYWPAVGRTARFALVNYLMVYVFGLSLALLMYEIGFKGGFFTVIYLPYMISGLALGFIAAMLFSQSTGTLNLLLLELGLIKTPIDIKLPMGTTIILPILVGWRTAGFYMAVFLAGLLSIPSETIEAAIVDGASYWQRLFRVYFPQMIPSFIIVTIFAMFRSFNLFDELVALGGLYQNKAAEFLSIIFFRYGFRADRLALGMTLAVMSFVPLFAVGLGLQRLQRRLQHY